jgi:hypothetical protein
VSNAQKSRRTRTDSPFALGSERVSEGRVFDEDRFNQFVIVEIDSDEVVAHFAEFDGDIATPDNRVLKVHDLGKLPPLDHRLFGSALARD